MRDGIIALVVMVSVAGVGPAVAADSIESRRSVELADLLEKSGYGDPELVAEAKSLWSSMASDGDMDAKYRLAGLLVATSRSAADDHRALLLYLAAAEQGHPGAQLQIGLEMEGVANDLPAAVIFYSRAAEQCNTAAYARLIGLYRDGAVGFAPDPEKLEFWRSYRSRECEAR